MLKCYVENCFNFVAGNETVMTCTKRFKDLNTKCHRKIDCMVAADVGQITE